MDPELFISYDLKMLNQTRVEFRNSNVNFQKEEEALFLFISLMIALEAA